MLPLWIPFLGASIAKMKMFQFPNFQHYHQPRSQALYYHCIGKLISMKLDGATRYFPAVNKRRGKFKLQRANRWWLSSKVNWSDNMAAIFEIIFDFRRSPQSLLQNLPKKYRFKMDKFHQFSFPVWSQFLSKSIVGQQHLQIMYIKHAKIVSSRNKKQTKRKCSKKPRENI